ncbi:PepSY domain-containing protein [Rhodovibrio salinarum]|uniref:PepSY domain-containing protein n=1 Tax=Rhodovibrio salinarum TaxID=1087 RepID=A0A934V154_9PROT|nr:PepSY domain-containing protein [Rhodovibrio salinarum]MBK1698366.1 PepSY domain-containing protein [Rhodovibrio salinarum]
MRTRSLLLASALVLASAAGTVALNGIQATHAASSGGAGDTGQSVQQQSRDDTNKLQTGQRTMPMEEVIGKLSRQGYSDIREVERDGPDRYEVDARDAEGRRVELKVDAVTGKVLSREDND